MRRNTILLFLSLLFALFSLQTAKADDAPYMAARHFTINDGLPSNCVNCLAQDNLGFIWVGTNAGLCRFDGYSFVAFPSISDKGEDTDQRIGFLINDSSSGRVRVVLSDKGEAYFDTSTDRFVDYRAGTGKETVLQPKNPYAATTGDNAYHVASVDGYECWANGAMLWLFDRQGRGESMTLIDNASLTTNRRQKYFITGMDNGWIAIGTYGSGLFLYDTKTKERRHLSATDNLRQLPSNYVTALAYDKGGTLWVGTENAGLTCINPTAGAGVSRLLPQPAIRGGKANAIRSIHIDGDGTVSMGTMENHVFRYQPSTGAFADEGDKGAMVFTLFTDSKGHKWVGTRGAGLYIDGVRYSKDDPTHPFPSNLIYDVVEDRQGNIFIGTWKDGLLITRYEEGQPMKFKQLLNYNQYVFRIHDICRAPDGAMWIATCGGLFCLPAGKEAKSDKDLKGYDTSNSALPGNEVTDVLVDHNNQYLWAVVIGNGVVRARIDKGELKDMELFDQKSGMPNNVPTSLIEDKEGNIWVPTEYGLSMIRTADNKISTFYFSQNIEDDTFTEGSGVMTADGTLYLGTLNGLLEVRDPQHLVPSFTHSPVITDITVNGVSVVNMESRPLKTSLNTTTKVSLSHKQNLLEIFFSDFDYTNAGSTIYEYYLEGIDKTWLPATSENKAHYAELPPGHYTFHVRHLNKDDEKTIDIVIRQPWYNTWWAWLLWLSILGAIAYLFYRSWRRNFELHQKIRMDEQLSEFRQSFFTNITHEFRTPLAVIQTAVQKMSDEMKQGVMPRKAADTVKRGSSRLMKLVNQFIDFRKMEKGQRRLQVEPTDLVKLLRTLQQDFWAMAHNKEIQLTFTPQKSSCEVLADTEAVETVVYNLLSNALKYTPAKGAVQMRLREDEASQTVVITVDDNGPGISEERQRHLFQPFMDGYVSQGGMGIGLSLSKQLAQAHHGDLAYLRSAELGGSSFIFTLPSNSEVYAEDEYKTATEDTPAVQETVSSEEAQRIYREILPDAINSQTVALIEDDPDMMQLISEEIAPFFKVRAYMNGKEGCEAILADRPDLLICDVMLPDMNGYDIVKALRKKEKEAGDDRLPVIMMTALDDENHQIRGYEAGADDYMVKPCNINVLLVRMAQLIKWRKERLEAKERFEASEQRDAAASAAADGQSSSAAAGTTASSSAASSALTPSASAAPIVSRRDKQLLDKVEAIVARNLNSPTFSVDRLAEMCHVGRTTFYGKMKELTGMSPNKYLQEQRMLTAARLIEEGELTISEIIERVGIQDSSYFYKCFKARFGVTPSKY